jgi:hypothetical protein
MSHFFAILLDEFLQRRRRPGDTRKKRDGQNKCDITADLRFIVAYLHENARFAGIPVRARPLRELLCLKRQDSPFAVLICMSVAMAKAELIS